MEKKTVVAVTGSDGAMGGEVVAHLLDSKCDFELRLFVYDKTKKLRPFFKSLLRRGKGRITVVRGDLANYDEVAQLIDGADYVIHCGAVIPPKSDHNPENTMNTNYLGTKNVVDAIHNSGHENEIKLVHISTVAVYGNRDYHHPWARMGDPVMASAYDYYSAAKVKGERYVLESDLPHWVVLRQTAVYHKYFLANNMNDGLMFHTCWNAPFEWITDRDSGNCIQKLVEKDLAGDLDGFWQNDYNIGGGEKCRETGYETFNFGFGLFGASAEKFFEPNWNNPRNFHGVWYTDSCVLDKWLGYRTESSADYWHRMEKDLWYYKLGAIVPSRLIRKFAIERLLKDTNAPMYWVKHNKTGRIDAFFGGRENYEKVPKTWDKFPLLAKNKAADGPYITEKAIDIDYADLKDEAKADRYALDHGYDDKKSDAEIDLGDLKSAAKFRGGEVVSEKMQKGDLHTKITWKCHNGHTFDAKPFTILKAGFWCPVCCEATPWAFDKVADKVPFYSQVYYDTHSKAESENVYPYDEHEDDDMIKAVEEL